MDLLIQKDTELKTDKQCICLQIKQTCIKETINRTTERSIHDGKQCVWFTQADRS